MQRCPCKQCNGLPRDKRTIRKHLSSPYQRIQEQNYRHETESNKSLAHGGGLENVKTNVNCWGKKSCFCEKCAGRIRDTRTVKAHLSNDDSTSGFTREFFYENTVVVSKVGEPSNYQLNAYPPDGNYPEGERDADPEDEPAADPEGEPDADPEGEPDADPEGEPDADPDINFEGDQDADPGGNPDPMVNRVPHADPDPPEGDDDKTLERAVLRIIQSKVNYGMSQDQTLTQLRNLFELTNDNRIPHSSWNTVTNFIKDLGYKEPTCRKVCFGNDHVTLIDGNQDCTDCGKVWKKCINYYTLGFQLEDLFASRYSIKEHMEHWKNKNEWFNVEEIAVPRTEVWHGDRFKELSYFWDENVSTLLPTICPNCEGIISADDLERLRPDEIPVDMGFVLLCCNCDYAFIHEPKFMKGSPLNQVYIFHEDGFNAFSSTTRGTAAIHLTNACTLKINRNKNTKVYSFIATTHIKEGIRHKMDAFFKPLIEEVKDLYINGRTIHLDEPLEINDDIIPAGDHQVRALILLGTADIKAHAEILMYASGGKTGCRRCLVQGEYLGDRRHYYYGHFRERYRFPPEARTHHFHYEHGLRCELAQTNAAINNIRKETGSSGVSFLYDLQKLYGFDPIKDMVVDKMHLSVNMLKKEFTERMWQDLGENADLAVNERNIQNGGLLLREEFKDGLEAVKWTREQKEKGVPKIKKLSDKLGGWKHDDYIKLSTVAREVLACKIPSRAYDSFILVSHIAHMLYSKTLQRKGWTERDIKDLSNCTWAHAIAAEEYYGLDVCSENLEYSVHIADDIRRHSSPDNFSCETFERSIRVYKMQSNNAKGVEGTYAERECIRSFLIKYEHMNGPLSRYGEGNLKYRFDLASIEHGNHIFLHEKSFKAAVELITELERIDNPIANFHLKSGVALGKIRLENQPHQVMQDIRRQLRILHPQIENINQLVLSVRTVPAVVKRNTFGDFIKISKGDTCILSSGEDLQEEWYLLVSKIFKVGPVAGNYHLMVDGTYYIPGFQNGQVAKHAWTLTTQLLPRQYARYSVQPMKNIKRKVILYPEPTSPHEPAYYLPIDFDQPSVLQDIKVPVWPQEEDTLSIKGVNGETWYAKVHQVNIQERSLHVFWCRETRPGIWCLTRQADIVNFNSVISLMHVRQVPGGFTFEEIGN